MIIGIDPGARGAIAGISRKDGSFKFIEDMPDLKEPNGRTLLSEIIRSNSLPGEGVRTSLWIENQQPMPTSMSRTMFFVGLGYGVLLATIRCLGLSANHVRAADWKRPLGLLKSGKDGSIKKAAQYFGIERLMRTKRCTRPMDGRADALLIAYYGRTQELAW